MGQILILKNKGLATAPNEFSSVPEGSLLTADNVSIDTDNILEPRRGFLRQIAFPDPTDRARRLAFYQSKQIAAYSNGKIAYNNSGTWSDYSGTYNDPDSTLGHIKFLLAASNLYFTSSTGVYRLDSYNSTPALSGVQKGLDLELLLVGTPGATIPTDNQVAYRMLWGFTDANKNLLLSAPSGRAVITNSSGSTKDVTITFTIPAGITTSDFFQVYRSAVSGSATVESDDELGLVYENNPTAPEIAAKVVTFTDTTPDTLRGATLYTSPSQQGILQSNERCPIAKDIALFQESTFYGNCTSKQRKIVTLLSAAALSLNDTITIAGTVYTVKNAETIASGYFKKFTSGTAAQNIADTAASLIRVINRYSSNTLVYATYLSAVNDLPGQIVIEERGLGSGTFTISSSTTTVAYNPDISSGKSITSTNDNFPHQVFFSKSSQPEAVPLLNYLFVGSANNAIRRIVPLRNSLFVFKENEGIYRITGNSPSTFEAQLFDSSARILGPDSVDVVNNEIWALTDQGIALISETGVSVISRPIENLILGPTGTAIDQIKQYSFGVGYETDRKYILWTVEASTDTVAPVAYVWNTFTRAFTKWTIPGTAAGVNPADGKLYIGAGDSNYMLQERKSLTFSDYVDYTLPLTITSFSGLDITVSDATNVEVGDILYQSSSVNSLITSIFGNIITVEDQLSGWTAASATALKSFTSIAEWTAISGGNPGTSKQYPEVAFLFRAAQFNSATASFATDVNGGFEDVSFLGNRVGLWGLFPWGTSPWGSVPTAIPIRVYTPLEKSRSSLLRVKFTIKQGFAAWKLNGLSIPYRDTGSHQISK